MIKGKSENPQSQLIARINPGVKKKWSFNLRLFFGNYSKLLSSVYNVFAKHKKKIADKEKTLQNQVMITARDTTDRMNSHIPRPAF